MTAAAAFENPDDEQPDLDVSVALLDIIGARLKVLKAEANNLVGIRRILITEMAQRDGSPLQCTASFVDVGDLP